LISRKYLKNGLMMDKARTLSLIVDELRILPKLAEN